MNYNFVTAFSKMLHTQTLPSALESLFPLQLYNHTNIQKIEIEKFPYIESRPEKWRWHTTEHPLSKFNDALSVNCEKIALTQKFKETNLREIILNAWRNRPTHVRAILETWKRFHVWYFYAPLPSIP